MPADNMTITANWTTGSDDAKGNNGTRDDLYASLTIAPGGALTVDKLFNDNINGAPAVLIKSTTDGTGSLIHSYDNVPATIQRYIPLPAASEDRYHTVSVPLTQASDPRSGLFMWSYLYSFNNVTQAWDPLGTSIYTPLNVNQGYLQYKYPGPTDWDQDTTYSFAGPINNGAFTCNVKYSDVLDNHNLVPNPYASAIDWKAASGWTKTNIYDAIWIYDSESGNYAAYGNDAGTNGATQYIPVGQAFMVSASAASPALSMNNDVRVHNTQAFYKNTDDVVDLLRIKTEANYRGDEVVVRFKEESTPAFDGDYDVTKFYGREEAPQLYTMSEDSKTLSINSLPFTPEVIVIPVGFKLSVSGLCTLEASSIESFDPSVTIFLEDMLTGDMTDLRLNPEYSFFHDTGNDPMRFKLIFNGTTAITEENTGDIQLYYADEHLYLNLSNEISGPVEVSVYNVNGQLEMSTRANTGTSVIRVPGLSFGAYMVRVISDDRSLVRKIMVN
jgi:hypothetical protein